MLQRGQGQTAAWSLLSQNQPANMAKDGERKDFGFYYLL